MWDFFLCMTFVSILVKPNSINDSIGKTSNGQIWIRVPEPAVNGKANLGVQRVLSNYLKIPKSQIALKAGRTGKFKIFEILTEDENKVMIAFASILEKN